MKIDEKVMKSSVLAKDGLVQAIRYHLAGFERLNDYRKYADLEAEDGRRNRQIRLSELNRCHARIARTNPKIQTTTRRKRDNIEQSRLSIVLSIFYFAAAAASLGISNIVGSAYVVGSGSDVFALDPIAAQALYIAPILGAIGIAAYEYNLRDDQERHAFRRICFLVGLVSCCVWALSCSISFLPNSGSTKWTAGGSESIGWFFLLLSQIAIDVSMGAVIFSIAQSMFVGDRIIIEVDNPAYKGLWDLIEILEAEIRRLDSFIGRAESYLHCLNQGKLALEAEVIQAFHFNTLQQTHRRQAQASRATLEFLNDE